MRGARCLLTFCVIAAGIIPADAGSTGLVVSGRQDLRDHPRGCGEHGVSALFGQKWIGSSPRMRGAQTTAPCITIFHGIIPADAGSTSLLC